MPPAADPASIPGTAPAPAKALVATVHANTAARPAGSGFGSAILRRMSVVDVSIVPKAEEPRKAEGRVVCGLAVEQDMVNALDNIHGGCSAFLIDTCSTLALVAFGKATGGSGSPGVSQALDVVYHAPAVLGDTLRVVSTTLTIGGRAMSARSEIWNTTTHRLVASGVHIKMLPAAPPPDAKL